MGDEWIKGEFILEHFTNRQSQSEPCFSEPIIVEGNLYSLKVFPNGLRQAIGTHITVYLERIFQRDLELN